MAEVNLEQQITTPSAQQAARAAFVDKYGAAPWPVPADQQAYFLHTKRPVDQLSPWKHVFIFPLLQRLHLLAPPEDPTYGRYTLPFSPVERAIRDDKTLTCWDGRIFLKNRADGVCEPVEDKTSHWIWYQVWWDEQASKRTGQDLDLLYCHGLGEYGGAFAKHARKFLDAGYRVIVLDLPSHGRSTGFHAHLTNFDSLAHAVHIVLADLTTRDLAAGRSQRSVVVGGQSLGGFTTVLYGLLYHSTPRQTRSIIEGLPRAKLVGLIPVCPMLAISPDSLPAKPVEMFARTIASFAGRLALAEAYKGKNSPDSWIESKFELDPQNYSGSLRVATGLEALKAVDYIDQNMAALAPPFLVIHGGSDRVTHPRGSIKLFESAASTQKSIKIYPALEHIVLRVGRDDDDDQARLTVLSEMLTWIDSVRPPAAHDA